MRPRGSNKVLDRDVFAPWLAENGRALLRLRPGFDKSVDYFDLTALQRANQRLLASVVHRDADMNQIVKGLFGDRFRGGLCAPST